MIYEVSEYGPWIDLDQLIAIFPCGSETVVIFENGQNLQISMRETEAVNLGKAWMAHRKGEDEPEAPPRRRTL